MNEIVNKFLLARDKFMPELLLREPGFTCSDIFRGFLGILLPAKQVILDRL